MRAVGLMVMSVASSLTCISFASYEAPRYWFKAAVIRSVSAFGRCLQWSLTLNLHLATQRVPGSGLLQALALMYVYHIDASLFRPALLFAI
jgi:hypothetical protein